MKIELISYSDIKLALEAGLTCTDSEDKIDEYNCESFLTKLLKHKSIFEHINYTFRIDGITRAMLLELERHRHISLSVKSTRWSLKKSIKKGNFEKYFPDKNNYNFSEEQNEAINKLDDISKELDDSIIEAAKLNIPNDFLKYYVQESLTTKFLFTLNARELMYIIELRSKSDVLHEFRVFCKELYNTIPEDHKFLYNGLLD